LIGRIRASWNAWRATRRYAAGDVDGAKEAMDRALEAHPELPLADQYLGILALKQGKIKEAETRLLQAAGRNGDPFVVRQGLGAIELLRGRYAEAEKRFSEALEAFPVAFEVGYHIGLCRLLAGKEREALLEFNRLLAREDGPLFQRLKRLHSTD
jgi:tetratricopeptide (TPR) repeat protein